MSEKVVVAGAGFGGVAAALELSRKGRDVTLIDRKPYHEFTPGIIDVFRGRVSEKSLKLKLEDFLSGTSVEFVQEEILEVDPEQEIVETSETEFEYSSLVVALGGEPRTFGLDISEVETCYTLQDAKDLNGRLEEEDSAAIVGSGYVGVEVAAELAEKGIDVTVIDGSTRPMSNSPEKASHKALDYMNDRDIAFRGGSRAVELEEGRVILESDKEVEADTVIWAGGVQAPEVVQESFECGEKGIDVNPGLCSKNYESVFAIGDSADDGSLKTAHNAMLQAETVAENVVKPTSEDLETYEGGRQMLVVSLGKTGIFLSGDTVIKNRFFRYLKDLVRIRYWMRLRKQKFKARFLG